MSSASSFPSDSVFAGIKPDDRPVIENVFAVMNGLCKDLKFCDQEIRTTQNGYVVIAKTCPHAMLTITDLQLIKDCNPVRVQNISVMWSDSGKLAVHVKVLNSTTPVTITETEVIRVKRKRIFGFF